MENNNVTMYTGATVNGVQREAEVMMRRHDVNHWPSLVDGLSQWETLVRQLDAKDVEVPVRAIVMDPTSGGLYNHMKNPNGNAGITPTHTALGHLMSFVKDTPTATVENLEAYPTHIRAQMLAHWTNHMPDRSVVMRTAVKHFDTASNVQERVIRAVVSDKHSQSNGDDLATITQLRRIDNMPGARMRVVKQWDNTHVEIVVPNKVIQPKPGVVIQARVNISNSETKGGSFEASIGSMNLVCLNGMTGYGNRSTISIRHMGDIRYKMLASIQTVTNLLDEHLAQFSEAYKAALPKPRAEVLEAVSRRYKLADNAATSIAALWDVDGERSAGDTVAGLANAMTRYAQALPVERALVIEATAGRIVADGLDAL